MELYDLNDFLKKQSNFFGYKINRREIKKLLSDDETSLNKYII